MSVTVDLVSMFLERAPLPTEVDPALGERLTEMWAQGRQAWPGIDLGAAAYVRHLADLVGTQSAAPALARLRAVDLYLAVACVAGNVEALRAFDVQLVLPARSVVARAADVVDADEFLQRLRERLLVAPEGMRSRLAGYSGKGKLSSWVRIAAQRLLIDEYRRRDPSVTHLGQEAVDPLPSTGADPELDVLRSTYREGFQAAFEAAFAALSARERTLLRYRYVDGLEVNQIASISGRHRVSVYRAIVKARQGLLEHLRRDMAERLQVGGSAADSVLRLMKSQLDVRLSQLLKSRS